MAAPAWDSGLAPMAINPLPPTFIDFFGGEAASTQSGANVPWNALLAAPIPYLRQPAWDRVAVEPQSATTYRGRGCIMKRVGVASHPVAKKPSTKAPAPTRVEPVEQVAITPPSPEHARSKRRREAYAPESTQCQFSGYPMSTAEVTRLFMAAKVDIANTILVHPSRTPLEERRNYRNGSHIQFVPAKRRLGEVSGGNRLPTYTHMMPILDKAADLGRDEIDMTTATIAETSAIMQDIRRDPRQRIAMYGAPYLSDITDMTEPESPTLIRAPRIKAESKSPTKRLARLTTPIKNGFNRLAQGFVKLPPIPAAKVSPSPTKTSSAPSTPLKNSPGSNKLSRTPPAISPSPVSGSMDVLTEEYIRETSPGRVFRLPSFADSSSPSRAFEPSSPIKSSPTRSSIKYNRPVAPTPSKWNRNEPTSPIPFSPIPSTPRHTDSPIGLASMAIQLTPTMSACQYEMVTPNKNAEFSFGDVSPSFNSFNPDSISWMQAASESSEPRRIKNVNAGRRRKSEPLIRKFLAQAARRQSVSPTKTILQRNETTHNASPTSTPPPATPIKADEPLPAIQHEEQYAIVEDVSTNQPIADRKTCETGPSTDTIESPKAENTAETEPTSQAVAEHNEPTNELVAEEVVQESITTTQSRNRVTTNEYGVLNIDTREYPDIFAAHMSPNKTGNLAIDQLAQMVEDRCAGQAKVVVVQENDRLVVRFKLPTEYAYLFPDSQGPDESRFTTSPSAISSSPRITFNAPKLSFDSPEQSVRSSMSTHLDITPIAKGFTSPRNSTKRVSFSLQEDIEITPQKNTPSAPSAVSPNSILKQTTITTPEVTQVVDTSSPMFSHLPASAKPLSPVQTTPRSATINSPVHLGESSVRRQTAKDTTPKQQQSPNPETDSNNATPTPATRSATRRSSQISTTPRSSPPLVQSFTPVNQSPPKYEAHATVSPERQEEVKDDTTKAPMPEDQVDVNGGVAKENTPEKNIPEEKLETTASNFRGHVYDSPGRDYIQNFINRTRPKQTLATDTGSPVAPATKRLPLVAMSPNMAGSKKGKRKVEECNDDQSPGKQTNEPASKRLRRTQCTEQRSDLETDTDDHPEIESPEAGVQAESTEISGVVDSQDDSEPAAPVTRSSSRLRSHAKPAAAPKSSLPTPIKIGRSGSNSHVMNASVKKGQQDLQAQTRKNTRRNRGDSELPAKYLEKQKGKQSDSSDEDIFDDAPSNSKGTRRVGWKEPLESIQEHGSDEETEKPEPKTKGRKTSTKATPKSLAKTRSAVVPKGASKDASKNAPKDTPKDAPKTATTKTRVTQGKAGIAKPRPTSRSKTTLKVAESLGMSSNGTPAKPQRVTRSRTRSQI